MLNTSVCLWFDMQFVASILPKPGKFVVGFFPGYLFGFVFFFLSNACFVILEDIGLLGDQSFKLEKKQNGREECPFFWKSVIHIKATLEVEYCVWKN